MMLKKSGFMFLLCFWVTLLFTGRLFPQQSDLSKTYQVRHLGTDQGLSQGSVYSILKDTYGYVWMTSYEGLNRFDGHSFVNFFDDPFDSTSIVGNYTIGLVEDPYGDIWIGSDKCLNKFQKESETFTQVWSLDAKKHPINSLHYPFYADSNEVYYINDREGLIKFNYHEQRRNILTGEVRYLHNDLIYNASYVDADKNIWTRLDAGLALMPADESGVKYYLSDHKDNQFGAPTFVYAIHEDTEGQILISTDKGICNLNIHRGQIETWICSDHTGIAYDFMILNDSLVWLGTNDSGLYLFNYKSNYIVRHLHKNDVGKHKIPNHSASYLYLDSDSLLWVSSDPNGVSLITQDPKPFKSYHQFVWNEKPYDPGGIRCFAEDSSGMLYIGTQEEGIILFDPNNSKIVRQVSPEIFSVNHARDIHFDKFGHGWFGTQEGLYHLDSRSEKVAKIELNIFSSVHPHVDNIWDIIELDDNDLMIASDAGIYCVSTRSLEVQEIPMFSDKSIGHISIDSTGNLFLSVENDGFILVPLKELKTEEKRLRLDIPIHHYFQGEMQVKFIHYSSRYDSYWICSTNGIYEVKIDGLTYVMDIQNYYGHEQGLLSKFIYGCLEDAAGHLWFSSNKGIYRLDPSIHKMDQFFVSDGLQGEEFNTNSFLETSKGEFYFGGVSGFTRFDPRLIKTNDRIPPDPMITALHINDSKENKRLSNQQNIQLAHYENTLNFSFVSTDHFSGGRNTYRYRLKNFESTWNYDEHVEEVRYVRVPPGSYTFEVQVANDNMKWNPHTAGLHLTILHPWWKSWWFYLSILGMLLLSSWSFARNRFNRIKRKEETNRKLAELQLSALQSQMNPHFVFNCMNTIDGFIATNDRQAASDLIASFSKLIRKSLELSRNKLISLAKEIEFVKDYIELEKQRFDYPFKVDIQIKHPEELRTNKIPPMTIQPIVENAIWHGLAHQKNTGLIRIIDGYDESHYYICVQDNGPGIAPSSSNKKGSLALRIVQERFDLLHESDNTPYRLTDKSHEVGKGAKICISIPRKKTTYNP